MPGTVEGLEHDVAVLSVTIWQLDYVVTSHRINDSFLQNEL